MNQVKLNELVKEKKITIPLYFLRMYKNFNLNVDEMILLLYLYDKDKMVFDPNLISKDLNEDTLSIMENISNLTDKNLISVNTIKNDKGIMEEIIDLGPLFEKITIKLMEELNSKERDDTNIHELIELEFNRKLTPLEHEVIDDWDNNGYSGELIRAAVKEASINGVNNLRYIDKILLEWSKKGYKKPEDIKKNSKEVKEKIEVFDCDWLNEDEEI